jgi:glucarate dehydratase
LKVTCVKATPVRVEMEAPLRWSMGIETGTTRTIIELYTDEGIVGLGETYGGASTVARIEESKPLFIGLDPFEIQTLIKRFEVFRVTSEQTARAAEMRYVSAGLEMAFWDILGKALNKPLYNLWGGAERAVVPFLAYVFYRYEQNGKGGESTPEQIADAYGDLVDRYGFQGIKFKGGVLDPDIELATMRLLRSRFGSQIRFLRFDPNQAWTVETSIRYLKKMNELDLEYCEDPTWNIEGMSLVRKTVDVPLATNQCVTSFDQLPSAIRSHAIDVILVDLYFWGGPSAARKLASLCEVFNIGLAIHSDRELGIGTAAGLHFTASTPMVSHHYDSHYHHQVEDIITEPFQFKDGGLRVPTGPGLGVTLDRKQFERCAQRYRDTGDAIEFFDPYRPEWVPHLPLW